MGEVRTIGLNIAKSVFQVHGVDAAGQVGVMCWRSLRSCHHAWWASKPAPHRTIDRESSLMTQSGHLQGGYGSSDNFSSSTPYDRGEERLHFHSGKERREELEQIAHEFAA